LPYFLPLPEDKNKNMGKYLIEGPLTNVVIASLMREEAPDITAGAMSVFIGKVRADIKKGKKVASIEYSAYPEMVETAGDKICETVKDRFPDMKSIRIVHSTGVVHAGEASLFIMVTAVHREEATIACKDALEMIKESFPVWKKEFFDDASSGWKHN